MIDSNANNKQKRKQHQRKPRIVGGQVVTNPEQRFPYLLFIMILICAVSTLYCPEIEILLRSLTLALVRDGILETLN